MKRITTFIITFIMIIACMSVACVSVNASSDYPGAVGWYIEGPTSQYMSGYTGLMRDVPGYTVTDKGIRIDPAPWADSTPYIGLRSENIYLKRGFFFNVSVDCFSYDATDKWVAFAISDRFNNEPGHSGGLYGQGVEIIIRLNEDCEAASFELAWSTRGTRTSVTRNSLEGYSDIINTKANGSYSTNEKYPSFQFEVRYNASNETYDLYINGARIPIIGDFFNEYFIWGKNDTYFGFSMYNDKVGGTAGCTVTAVGDSYKTEVPYYMSGTGEPVIYVNTPVQTEPSTEEPTAEPTEEPTAEPTEEPTAESTEEPTAEPTEEPTAEPTEEPTAEPTEEPTAEPTEEPTAEPTEEPTAEPTEEPTAEPTEEPTAEPTEEPTAEPTEEPTAEPTEEPTAEPTEEPTAEPTEEPTAEPTEEPTAESTDSEAPNGPQEVTETETNGDEHDISISGCGSAVGSYTIAIAVTAAIGFVSFRKRDEE